jgi:hypothetical protein
MYSFKDFLQKKEWYGGSSNDPSSVDDEGDGGDGVDRRMEKPGAFPTYGDDLPITKKNRTNKQRLPGKAVYKNKGFKI